MTPSIKMSPRSISLINQNNSPSPQFTSDSSQEESKQPMFSVPQLSINTSLSPANASGVGKKRKLSDTVENEISYLSHKSFSPNKLFQAKKAKIENSSMEELACSHYKLGMSHETGRFVERNAEKAFYHFKAAADLGHVEAQFQAAVYFEDGIGTAENLQEAVHYYHMAADNGHVIAQFNLAMNYEEGMGVEKDFALAFHYYQLSYENGEKEALYHIAAYYEHGLGIEQNSEKALHYYKLAAQKDFNYLPKYRDLSAAVTMSKLISSTNRLAEPVSGV